MPRSRHAFPRPPCTQAAAAGFALAMLLGPGAGAETVEIVRGAYPSQLMDRAESSIRLRDFSAARSLYEAAARKGVGPAATAIGKTYDPAQLARTGSTIAPDPDLAEHWYRQGADLGDPEASVLLQSLLDRKGSPAAEARRDEPLDRLLGALGMDHPTDEDRRRAAEIRNIPHIPRSIPR